MSSLRIPSACFAEPEKARPERRPERPKPSASAARPPMPFVPSLPMPPRHFQGTTVKLRVPVDRSAQRERERNVAEQGPPWTGSIDPDASPFGLFPWLGGQGADDGDGEDQGGCGAGAADGVNGLDPNHEFDCNALADSLLPMTAEDGIFEVLMPNGQTLGVAVSNQSTQVRLLLSPSDEKLAERLRRRKMELEGALGRRMNKYVDITVL
ncbi:MAG TPA: hypothetical protein VJ654_03375 [Noviherbaspirillum sp.]|nr:hypothetical protein [Noviherbaspirillum sp.]